MLAWLPVESTIRWRRAGYYEALTKSDAAGFGEEFIGFMLGTIRGSFLPLSRPEGEGEPARSRTPNFFRGYDDGGVSQLTGVLDCLKKSAERMVTGLKEEGVLSGQGSTWSGIWIVHEWSVTL